VIESGSKLAHYEVVSALGKGGMGEVWRAKDTKLGREVAIKTLPAEFDQDADRLARFEREAKLLASLNHPNIAAIYGLEEHESIRFLVLELVEGDTLAERLGRGAIPVAEALKFALQVAEALEAAHDKGVIHRDLKPANIKITPEGKVKVLDFGLAKAFAGDGADVNPSNSPTLSMAATQQGVVLGTAGYMSPEQASGEVADRRADIWAFGVVLFEMLTGRQLFTGKTVTHIMADVLRTEPDWNALPANLHPRIRLLLERALEKEVKDRLSGISDTRVELERVLADPSGVVIQPVSLDASPDRRARMPWALSEIITVVAALVASVAAWNLKPSDTGPVMRLDIAIPVDQAPGALPRVLDVSRDGRRVAFVGAGNLQVFLRNLDETQARPIQGATAGLLGGPTFSPEGDWVAYFSGNMIYKIPVTGGSPLTVFEGTTAVSLSWDERDMLMFADEAGAGIWQVPADGGGMAELIVPAGEGETLSTPRLLPDGDSVLFTSTTATGANRWDAGQIFAYSLRSGDRTLIWSGGSDARYAPSGHIVYAQSDSLFGLPFDLGKLEVTSNSPSRLVEGIINSPVPVVWNTAQYAISDTGSLIYITGGDSGLASLLNLTEEETILVIANLDGSSLPLGAEPRNYLRPRVSPDGSRIAVEVAGADTHIWILDASTGFGEQLTFEGGLNQMPVWSADGQSVLFRSDRLGGAPNAIFRRSASGEGAAELVLERDRAVMPSDLSADGVLAFLEVDGANPDIWTVDLEDPDSAEVFLATPSSETAAQFSPDGRWLAYISNESGQNRVYVRAYPRADDTQRQVSERFMFGPVWSPTADELYAFEIVLIPTLDIGLTATSVRTEPEFSVTGRPRLLFDSSIGFTLDDDNMPTAPYDIMPDGDSFVFVAPAGDTGPAELSAVTQINIVLNWFEELKERVPVD
jgi:serine/threonine protein kinase/Tol biopolymer transport system component